ncbi:MAG: Imm1 family immunity protein [Actinomycetota bacterium]|nr:Imm1 family immunity protein [Actinomycetota bacterium]
MTTPDIVSQDIYDLADHDVRLLATMAAVNAMRENPETGIVWWLLAGDQQPRRLVAGVRGTRGVLMWTDSTDSYQPESGDNDQYVDYFTWEGHHFALPPGTEVPIEVVYDAVRECVKTLAQPTCVRWVPMPDPDATPAR